MHGVDDLVAHFENFNMEDLQASGSPILHRSISQRQALSPKERSREMQQVDMSGSINRRHNLKLELDQKKVRMLELETENGEMKTLIE